MGTRGLRLAAGALALVAAGISAYLVEVHYAGGPIACFAGGGCETVQKSAYSQIGGVPLAVLGLAAYVALALSQLWRGEEGATVAFGLGVSVAVFATYLIVVQVAVVDAICPWCMTTDAIAWVLVALTGLRLRAEVRAQGAAPGGPAGDGGSAAPGALRDTPSLG